MADSSSRQGSRYATAQVLAWLDGLHASHDAGLQRAYDAPQREGLPAIHVAPSEGKLLEQLMRLIGAKRVLEVGTLAGYSAIRLARGLAPGGRVWSLELDEQAARIARGNLTAAGVGDRAEVVVGDAAQTLAGLERHGPFDAMFIDADKERYDVYGRWAAKHLRPGGLLLADNAYFFGQLMGDTPAALAMRRFHQEAVRAFDTVCVPTPDGLLFGVRRG